MRKKLLATLFCLTALFAFHVTANAQGTLIHYWNFNNFTAVYHNGAGLNPAFPPIDADFSIHDTSKARIVFTMFPGTSLTYLTYLDEVAAASGTPDYDTVNVQLGAPAGNALRPRNPLDSVYLYFYIPTINYQNIRITYGTESSSVGSGDTYQLFDYSVDSGVTWTTTGLSELQDSAWLVFKRVSVTISNPLVNNNPKLVFRIHFSGHTTGTSGNNRFDNVSVMGDSIIAPVPIHYWNFNSFTSTYHNGAGFNPTFPPIDADYSAIDPTKATIVFTMFPGTSLTYLTYLDEVAATTGTPDYDTVNLLMGATSGNAIRPRNPLDSVYLYYYIPTTGYHNISVAWGAESSSTGSGDGEEVFDYSKDSGVTWNTALLSEPYDSAWLVFKRISVNFTSDSGVNNNPKLVFCIHFKNHNTGTSGNNRIDNVSVFGIPYIANNSIATTAASYGPFCNAGTATLSVAYTAIGTFTGTYYVQLSNVGGTFPNDTVSNLIGTGTGTSPISATIPAGKTPGNYRVRVINSAPGTFGTDNGTNIIINGPPTAETVTGGGGYCAGGAGLPVGLSSSQTGVSYQLYRSTIISVGSPVAGTGGSFNFSSQTTGGAYTVVATNAITPTCTNNMTGSVTVTVNPVPSVITGTAVTGGIATICAGNIATLNDTIPGGTWSSGFTSVATVDPLPGAVNAVSPGLSVITYTLPGGCFKTANVLVNPAVSAIGGTTNVCPGAITPLFDFAVGTWASGNTALATVDLSGNVGGVAAGVPVISYIVSPGCYELSTVTVNPLPSSIGGTPAVCVGSATNLNDAGGGTWSSSDGTLATVDPALGIVSGVAPGNPVITYTLPTGCAITTTVAVNPLPSAVLGTASVCIGTTTLLNDAGGGNWSSSNTALATVDNTGLVTGIATGTPNIIFTLPTGCTAIAAVTVNSSPSAIMGTMNVCAGLTTPLGDLSTGGTWTSSDLTLATVDPVSGIVTGVAAGSPNIVYALSAGCLTSTSVLVNPMPSAITGITNVCTGSTTNLSDPDAGGTWGSSNISSATIDFTGGIVSGMAVGTPAITYTSLTGCTTTVNITVNPSPAAISGNSTVCVGMSTPLGDINGGGTWSTSDPTLALVDPALGSVTGVLRGSPVITYTLPTGCAMAKTIVVNPLPAAIGGAATVCMGATTTLSDDGTGTWSSSNTAHATVNVTSGIVTGINGGVANITYSLGTGCTATIPVTVFPVAPITGSSHVCAGASALLSNSSAGGVWSSSDNTLATVNPVTGMVTGVAGGLPTIIYTSLSGCPATTPVIVNAAPAGYSITGGGNICAGATGIPVELSGSVSGVSYQLFNGITPLTSLAGTGVPLNFGLHSVAGIYTVVATNLVTGCSATMPGTAPVVVNATPAVYTVMGGGSYCSGSGGLHISLSGSGLGVHYQLYHGITTVGSPVAGTGSSLDFGAMTLDEVYTVIATNDTSLCADNMAGAASVITNPLPAVYPVIEGGSYCAGGTGVPVVLALSNSGVNYQLYNGATAVGAAVAGGTGAVNFGLQTVAGIYTVKAINAVTGCISNMSGVAAVTVTPVISPSVTLSTGVGDTICSGSFANITAVSANGGTAPVYQWAVNGAPHPAFSNTLNYLPADGDIVTVTLTSNASCAYPVTATTAIGLTVFERGAPAATISAAPGNTVCTGTLVDYTNTNVYAGIPVFTWVVNGISMTNDPFYSYMPVNGDNIYLQMVSNYYCRTTDTVSSNHIIMDVQAPAAPIVTISAYPDTDIVRGEPVTFTANVVANGGPAPTLQWQVNGVNVPGAISSTFTSSNLTDGAIVNCEVLSSGICAGQQGHKSATIHVNTTGVQQITSNNSNIQLVPNPNKGAFTVKGSLGATNDQEISLVVTDMLGQVIYRSTVTAQNGIINEQVLLNSNLANGMYLLNVRSGDQDAIFHFVVEK